MKMRVQPSVAPACWSGVRSFALFTLFLLFSAIAQAQNRYQTGRDSTATSIIQHLIDGYQVCKGYIDFTDHVGARSGIQKDCFGMADLTDEQINRLMQEYRALERAVHTD